ncbi:hypothetical protein SNE40_020525 [Patella caerulea]|uniref:Microsomal glutathione S-transferase 1 n=1 Tax=Patella caerulea TaxID=87958 RepID=A0AAN8G4R1_PATCE
MSDVLSFGNPVFQQFALYSGLVIGKTLLMGPITSFFRLRHDTYSNEEDCKLSKDKSLKPRFDDLTVERIRRCHQNDVENVIPFVLFGLFYVATEPYPEVASILFKTFAASRFLHTLCYMVPLPQPSRFVCFLTGAGVTGAMAFRVLMFSSL